MAIKTLSVDDEAYAMLRRAKRNPRESFSQVIKRAQWPDSKRNCASLLDRVSSGVPDAILDALDAAQLIPSKPKGILGI